MDDDPPRAYPIRILAHHEVVNDVVESESEANATTSDGRSQPGTPSGRPIAVTWCPICWSAAVYDRDVDGRTLTFGVSGTLADDALVLYDRETETRWQQTSGRAIDGDLAETQLATLPAAIVTARQFAEQHPDGVVVQPIIGPEDPGIAIASAYSTVPYEAYASGDEFGLYGMRGEGEPRSWEREDLAPKTLVLGVEHAGDAVGYPVPVVEANGGLVTDTVGGLDVVVTASDEGLHAFDRSGHEFERRGDDLVADGATWDPVTGESDDGRCLERVTARQLFAFAWQDVHGQAALYERDQSTPASG